MNLRAYRVFCAAAETGSFTEAAKKLYMTQSGVSHAVRELENEAGTRLFERLAKRVRLTESGRLLLSELQPFLEQAEKMEERVKNLEKEAPIRLVSNITIASFWLPGILRRFYERMPGTPVEVKVMAAAQAAAVLHKGEADLAFLEGVLPPGPFEASPFAKYRLMAACAPEYSPKKSPLDPKGLCGERLLLREKGSAVRDVLDSALLLAGCQAFPVWESVDSEALLGACRAGLGITVLPDLVMERDLSEKKLVPVEMEGLDLINRMYLVRHREKYLSAPLAAFLECASALRVDKVQP